MSISDRSKWDDKYARNPELLSPRPPSRMVEKYHSLARGENALDLACGSGRHSLFLSENGFNVDAVDISKVAIETLSQRAADRKINPIEADLDSYEPPKDHYDIIVKTNYLDRDLTERAKSSLKRGGIFIVETYVQDEENEKKDSNPDYLLQKDELLSIFSEGFEVLEHISFWNEGYEKYRMKKESIAARKL